MISLPAGISAALLTLIAELRPTALIWAITGSASLALQGIQVDVHDIDLRTTAADAYAIEAALARFRVRPVRVTSTGLVQSHFGALDISGVQVEIIGDMQHRLADGSWEPVTDMRPHMRWVNYQGQTVPVMSLPFLLHAYRLLGRAEKVALLQRFLDGRDA